MGQAATVSIIDVPEAYLPYLQKAQANSTACHSTTWRADFSPSSVPDMEMTVRPAEAQAAARAYCRDNPADCNAFVDYVVQIGAYSRELMHTDLQANGNLVCQIIEQAGPSVSYNEIDLQLAIVACKRRGFTDAQITALLVGIVREDAVNAFISLLKSMPQGTFSNQQVINLLSAWAERRETGKTEILTALPAAIDSCKQAGFSSRQTTKLLSDIIRLAEWTTVPKCYQHLALVLAAFKHEKVAAATAFAFLDETVNQHAKSWVAEALPALSKAAEIGLNFSQIKSIFNQIYGLPGGDVYRNIIPALQACQQAQLTGAQTTQLLRAATDHGYLSLPDILPAAQRNNITLDDLIKIMGKVAWLTGGGFTLEQIFATLPQFFETCCRVGLSSAQVTKLVIDLADKPGASFDDQLFPTLGEALVALHDFKIAGDDLVALVIDITPGFSTEEMRMSEAGVIGGSGLRYWTVPVICRAFRSVGFDKNQVEMWLRKISVIAKNDTDSTYLAFAAMLENDFSAEQSLKLIADIAQSTSAFAIWQNPMGSSDPENAYAISVSTGQIYELIPEAIKTCRTFGFTADQTVEILGNKYFANAARWLNRFTIDSSYQHLSEILGVCKEKGLNIEEAYNLFTRVFALIDTKLKAIFHQIKGSASVSAFAYEIFTSMLPEAIKEAGDAGLTGEQLVTCTLALVEEKYRASL